MAWRPRACRRPPDRSRRRGFDPEVRDNLRQASGVRSVAVADGTPIDFDYRALPRCATRRRRVRHGAGHARRRELPRDHRRAARCAAGRSRPRTASWRAGRGDFRTARGAAVPWRRADRRAGEVTLEDSREQEFTVVGVTADFATSQLTTEAAADPAAAAGGALRRRCTSSSRGAPGDEPQVEVRPGKRASRARASRRCPAWRFPGSSPGRTSSRRARAIWLPSPPRVGIAGGLVLVLAALGIVGVVGFMVATRTARIRGPDGARVHAPARVPA